MDLVDGVWCEVVYALDKQLRWIEKNFQPGTKRVQARLRAQELAMKNGDDRRVVEARPVRDPSRPWVNPPARGAGPDADQEDFALREWLHAPSKCARAIATARWCERRRGSGSARWRRRAGEDD